MALGLKRIETRHWLTRYRGPLAIHAAKRWTAEEREDLEMMRAGGFFPAGHVKIPLGAVVAVGRLIDIKRTEQLVDLISKQEEAWGNYGPRRYGWIFEDVTALAEPIAIRGAQGLFEFPDDVLVGGAIPPELLPAEKPSPAPKPAPRIVQPDLFGGAA